MKLVVTTLLTAAAVCPSAAIAQTDLGPLNLPAMSAPMPLAEDFEAAAGVIPPYMALTALDAASLTPDSEAWCNIGQDAACITPYSGSFNLEMGLTPSSTNYHYVRNAMVLAVDGTNYPGGRDLSFMGIQMGEEDHLVDGVWISDDGSNWYQVWGPWGTFASNTWTDSGLISLLGTPVNTAGVFYVAFLQEDNFPYDDLDGAGVDDILIESAPPQLSVDQLHAGQYSTLFVSSGLADRPCKFLSSISGPGPTLLGGNLYVDLDRPIYELADIRTDAIGDAVLSTIVPPGMAGTQVWLQAVVFDVGAAYASTLVTDTIQ